MAADDLQTLNLTADVHRRQKSETGLTMTNLKVPHFICWVDLGFKRRLTMEALQLLFHSICQRTTTNWSQSLGQAKKNNCGTSR